MYRGKNKVVAAMFAVSEPCLKMGILVLLFNIISPQMITSFTSYVHLYNGFQIIQCSHFLLNQQTYKIVHNTD